MSVTRRFEERLPQPTFLPSSSSPATGQYPSLTLTCEEWIGVEGDIAATTHTWLAAQAQDPVYWPPQEHEMLATSEAGVATQLAGQVSVLQKALNQASLGAEWLQEPAKYSDSQAGSSRSRRSAATIDPPAEGMEVAGGGLLRKPNFEMVEDRVCRTFLEVKVP